MPKSASVLLITEGGPKLLEYLGVPIGHSEYSDFFLYFSLFLEDEILSNSTNLALKNLALLNIIYLSNYYGFFGAYSFNQILRTSLFISHLNNILQKAKELEIIEKSFIYLFPKLEDKKIKIAKNQNIILFYLNIPAFYFFYKTANPYIDILYGGIIDKIYIVQDIAEIIAKSSLYLMEIFDFSVFF